MLHMSSFVSSLSSSLVWFVDAVGNPKGFCTVTQLFSVLCHVRSH